MHEQRVRTQSIAGRGHTEIAAADRRAHICAEGILLSDTSLLHLDRYAAARTPSGMLSQNEDATGHSPSASTVVPAPDKQ